MTPTGASPSTNIGSSPRVCAPASGGAEGEVGAPASKGKQMSESDGLLSVCVELGASSLAVATPWLPPNPFNCTGHPQFKRV